MPFIANTPESLVARTDSKNPGSTCRGITASGRPCRRPVSPTNSPQTLLPRPGRTKRIVVDDDPSDETLYCWQHKDQAALSARSSPGPRANATPILEERTSLDTLADRLGLVDIEEKKHGKKPTKRKQQNGRPPQKIPVAAAKPPPATKKLSCCFCFSIPIDEVQEMPRPARPLPKPVQQVPVTTVRPGRRPVANNSASLSPSKHSRKSSSMSQTGSYLSLIPADTDPQTASALMAELARPYVDSEDAGYIYMFWMTPANNSSNSTSSRGLAPPVDAARSLLAPPTASSRSRRPSDAVAAFARSSNASHEKTMLLKIGRASNVQRRMQQWSRQCGYEIEVLRYYPYLPGSSEASGELPRMTPHAHRVERLVHIELAGMGLRAARASCDACGRDHREWFEVDASRHGVGKVDEVIRRWVGWDEAQP
ncbi:meiotically up-regulated gene 113-domain-containing protein [Plectosphaerella plurivora]|uniref:Meiotically up-regulated gene 113-domain-containing protein n=1 Tax=Plectosphaerella plurivora TaxID=936078 RepID=A0A9P9A4R2_9PEZI|nr:meiotically up-regulated gene 113-domain-containing protein [Plectosphaerella plurivora]